MLMFGVYLYVLLFLATGAVHAEILCNCAQPDARFADGVNFIYYYCNGTNISVPIGNPQELLNVIDDTKWTVFYIFGWTQTPQTLNVSHMIEALCYNKKDNVVLLDWSKYSGYNLSTVDREIKYPLIAIDAMNIGVLFADALKELKDNGFNTDMVYIVAHSMGAVIAGTTGKCTQKQHSFTIPRITGLDPANPLFDLEFLTCHLKSEDANCVDVIHTDMGGYGTLKKCGKADYYPNGGKRLQPGCSPAIPFSNGDFCSHHFSVELYIAMIYHPKEFIGIQCDYVYPSHRVCPSSTIVDIRVGYAASCDVRGDFYFNTTES